MSENYEWQVKDSNDGGPFTVMKTYIREPRMECPKCGEKEYTFMAGTNVDYMSTGVADYVKAIFSDQTVADRMEEYLSVIKYCHACEHVVTQEKNKEKGKDEDWEAVLGISVMEYLEEEYNL